MCLKKCFKVIGIYIVALVISILLLCELMQYLGFQTPMLSNKKSANVIDMHIKNLYPEGIAADSEGNLYVGSLVQGMIYKITKSGKISKFLSPKNGDLMSVTGMIVDGNILWACSSDPGVSKIYRQRSYIFKKK